jgi:hypothetical protein
MSLRRVVTGSALAGTLAVLGGACTTSESAPAPPFCTVPLTDAGPSIIDDTAVAALCAANPGRVQEWKTPCGPYLAVFVLVGVDCNREYVFDATTRQLVAVVAGCNGEEKCVQGDSRFVPPTDQDAGFHDTQCLSAREAVDVCPSAGGGSDAGTAD